MHNVQSLIQDLKNSGVDPSGTLLVHSSVKAVGKCERRGDTIIDALIEYMRDGLLILPTHTWDKINAEYNIYDPETEPSCVGVLTNLFLKRPGVIRSLHPTHSVAAIGKNAAVFVSGEEKTRTPCPRDGVYGKLYDLNAQILLLGCGFSSYTYIHCIEEWMDIPDRLNTVTQELFVKTADGLIPCPQHRHHCSHTNDISKNYVKMEKAFIKTGAAIYCRIGDAKSILCDAKKTADLTIRCLQETPNLFADKSEY